MKKNIFFNLVMFSVLSFYSQAQAGASSSSGGGAYVCRNSQGQITQSLLHDLWEHDAINFPETRFPQRSLTIVESNDPVDEQLNEALAKLAHIDPVIAKEVKLQLIIIRNQANWWRLPDHMSIPTPLDAQNDYEPLDCPLTGMMLFHDEEKVLSIKQEIFDRLKNNTHIAASWMHEALYKVRREKFSYVNGQIGNSSKPVRKLNACLFSEDTFTAKCLGKMADQLPPNTAFECSNTEIKTYLATRNGIAFDLYLWDVNDIKIRRYIGPIVESREAGTFGLAIKTTASNFLGHIVGNIAGNLHLYKPHIPKIPKEIELKFLKLGDQTWDKGILSCTKI